MYLYGFFEDSEGESYRQFLASFDRVRETGEPDEIAHIRYDIPDQKGSFDTHYWSATHTPIKDADGNVELILQHTVDITEVEELRRMREAMGVLKRAQAVEERYADASKELMQLRALLEQAPGFVAVLGTSEHRFVMANVAYRKLVGGRDLIGKMVGEALPELIAQGFIDTLDRVYATGEPYFGAREEVMMQTSQDEDLEQMSIAAENRTPDECVDQLQESLLRVLLERVPQRRISTTTPGHPWCREVKSNIILG